MSFEHQNYEPRCTGSNNGLHCNACSVKQEACCLCGQRPAEPGPEGQQQGSPPTSVQRWIKVRGEVIRYPDGPKDSPGYVEEFLDEIMAVCKKHGLSIAHEDSGGAFIVEPFNGRDVKWLRDAHLDIPFAGWKPPRS